MVGDRQLQTEASDALSEHAALKEGSPESNGRRQDLLRHVSTLLGMEILSITHYVAEPDEYVLETKGRRFSLPGGVSAVLEQYAFRHAVGAATGFRVQEMPRERWHRVSQALLDSCVHPPAEAESTVAGRMLVTLDEYLTDRPPIPADHERDYDEALSLGAPVLDHEGRALFHLAHLRKWLYAARLERPSAREIAAALRLAGVESVPLRHGKVMLRRWRLHAP